ncbi:hypothetical protein Tco_0530842 [Tanacetum coccineum]
MARENGTSTGVVRRSVFSCRSQPRQLLNTARDRTTRALEWCAVGSARANGTAYSNPLNMAYRSSDTTAERITMTKVIKEEFEQLGLLKIDDDLFTYDTQLGMIFNEFNRLSGIDDDLFTYEIEVPKPTSCDEQRTSDPTHNDLREYEWKMSYEECEKIYAEVVIFINKRLVRLIDVTVEQWLDIKYGNNKTMDKNIKKGVIVANLSVSRMEKLSGPPAVQMMMDSVMVENYREWFENGKASNNSDVQEMEEQHKERRCDTTHNAPVCKIKRFEMIKYSFGQDEKYVAIKECEYDDLTKTNEDACRAYQEIFRSIDEGWVVTRAE